MNRTVCCIAIVLTLLCATSSASAQFVLDWHTIDSGGGTAVGGGFQLSGTVGQPDARGPLVGAEWTLAGGFWPGVPVNGPDLLGDMNCDGSVTVGDINPFVLALTDPAGYADMFPDCNILNGDCSDDGSISVGDINCFVALVTGG